MAKDERGDVRIVKRITPWSLAKVMAILGVILGFISAVLSIVLRGVLEKAAASNPVLASSPLLQAPVSYWSLIIVPLELGIIYLISGFVGSWLYNLVSGWVGGLEVHLK